MGGMGSTMESHPSSELAFNEHSPDDCVACDTANLLPVYWKNFFLGYSEPQMLVCLPWGYISGENGKQAKCSTAANWLNKPWCSYLIEKQPAV